MDPQGKQTEKHVLIQSLCRIEKIVGILYQEYPKLFNEVGCEPVHNDDDITEEHLSRYKKPSARLVGSIVDVRVGHIDQFKFHEEFQVDYHLKKAGFLK